ncbi:MAG TPA: M28 family metallopeptidase [Gammaproteobacteria bacterium]|nr:M28 family metallopeptidase [Gammaproteobacteria bacterium]
MQHRMYPFHSFCLTLALIVPVAASAEPPANPTPPETQPVLHEIVDAVQPANLQQSLTKLVGFGTRHSLSETKSDTHGIGAARRWVKQQFEAISRQCGGCLEVKMLRRHFKGRRAPKGVEIVDVVAIQRGAHDPNRHIIMTAHLDNRVSDIMNTTSFAPGADDDGSGIAAMLEVARILSHYKFNASIVYSADSGEEQGLYGGRIIADYASAQGWDVEANLNNDMIGNAHGSDGIVDTTTGRIFSEAVKSRLSENDLDTLRYTGGFVDSPSRNVARYITRLADTYIPNFHLMLMYRQDRFHRGGDQIAFNRNGFPAVRLNEAHENWRHQHQDVRKEKGVQYGDLVKFVSIPFLANMTAANAIAIASMAWAPAPPANVSIKGGLSPDTTLSWSAADQDNAPNLAGYKIYWRRTAAPMWQESRWVGKTIRYTLNNLVIDNWYFGVASVSADGFESPVVFPGVGGAFKPAP